MQFDVYANPSPRMRDRYPLVVDVQSELLERLPSRLVVPLAATGVIAADLPRRLCPIFVIEQKDLMLVPFLAAPLDKRLLKTKVDSLRERAHEVISALDTVLSGI